MTTNTLSTKCRRNKRLYIIIAAIILACAAGGTALALSIINKPKSETAEESTPNDSTDGESDGDIAPAGASGEDKFNEVPQYEGSDPNTLEELTGSITFAQVNEGTLVIRVNIDQALSSGTCSLALNGPSTYTAESAIIPTGSLYSSCEGFDIPVSALSSGAWNINIRLTSDNKAGTITGSVTL